MFKEDTKGMISAFYLNRCISDHIYIKEVSYGRSEDFD